MSKSKSRDTNGIIEILNEEKDKMLNIVISFFKKKGENVQEEMRCRRLGFFFFFLVRECATSL